MFSKFSQFVAGSAVVLALAAPAAAQQPSQPLTGGDRDNVLLGLGLTFLDGGGDTGGGVSDGLDESGDEGMGELPDLDCEPQPPWYYPKEPLATSALEIRQWRWIAVEEMRCANDTTGGFFTSISEDPRDLVIFFGGGVPIYRNGQIIGGLGISGDTSCADHEIAKRLRNVAGLNPPGGALVDDIVYSPPDPASVFAHPVCLNTYRNGVKIGDEQPEQYPFVP